MRGRLLDTNVLSERLKKRPDPEVLRRWDSLDRGSALASCLTRYELRSGAELHPRRAELWARIESEILPRCRWIPFDEPSADAAGVLTSRLRRLGRPIDALDCLIAGVALAHSLVLVTRNIRHFERVPGLQLENWFERK